MSTGMKMTMIFWVLWALAGCGLWEQKEDVSEQSGTRDDRYAQLAVEADDMQEQIELGRDQESGWVSYEDCDGTLWTGLACAAGVPGVKLELAELAPGVIGRRPGRACWADGQDMGSRSTTSSDMATGYIWCGWRASKVELLQRFADACEDRMLVTDPLPACVIGEPFPEMASRVVMRPNLLRILGRGLFKLTAGADQRDFRDAPALYSAGGEDFERHLAALGIALNGEVSPEDLPLAAPELGDGVATLTDISQGMLEVLRRLVEIDPKDWTAQAVLSIYTGDANEVLDLLLDPATPCPSYARGAELNCSVSWLFAARLVLKHQPEEVK